MDASSSFNQPIGLDAIQGQPLAIRVLRHAIATQKLHQTYIFEGPVGVGKSTCATALFLSLNCLQPPRPGEGCGQCTSCLKVKDGAHPDLIVMDMSLSGLAEEVERVLQRVSYPPHEGRFSMVLIDPADQLSAPSAAVAANRLLKTLEEPNQRILFILISTHAYQLLPTIRSRAQNVRFAPLNDDTIRSILTSTHGVSSDVLEDVVAICHGSLGQAMDFISNQPIWEERIRIGNNLLAAAQDGSAQQIVSACSAPGLSDREDVLLVLKWLMSRMYHQARQHTSSDQVASSLLHIQYVEQAMVAIQRYTNPQLALERMLRMIRSDKSSYNITSPIGKYP